MEGFGGNTPRGVQPDRVPGRVREPVTPGGSRNPAPGGCGVSGIQDRDPRRPPRIGQDPGSDPEGRTAASGFSSEPRSGRFGGTLEQDAPGSSKDLDHHGELGRAVDLLVQVGTDRAGILMGTRPGILSTGHTRPIARGSGVDLLMERLMPRRVRSQHAQSDQQQRTHHRREGGPPACNSMCFDHLQSVCMKQMKG